MLVYFSIHILDFTDSWRIFFSIFFFLYRLNERWVKVHQSMQPKLRMQWMLQSVCWINFPSFLWIVFYVSCSMIVLQICWLSSLYTLFNPVSKDDLERLFVKFRRLDVDRSGTLSVDEFMAIPELPHNPLVSSTTHFIDNLNSNKLKPGILTPTPTLLFP